MAIKSRREEHPCRRLCFEKEVTNIMEIIMPEEIQKKVKYIEKELNDKRRSDNKLALLVSLIGILIGLAIFFVFISYK